MTAAKDLPALAERCEAAEAADKLLDCDIHDAIGLSVYRKPRRYTASIDAALQLVPEGWTLTIRQQDKGWAADLQKGYRTSYSTVVFSERGPNGWQTNPALAVAAVALRARSHQENDNAD